MRDDVRQLLPLGGRHHGKLVRALQVAPEFSSCDVGYSNIHEAHAGFIACSGAGCFWPEFQPFGLGRQHVYVVSVLVLTLSRAR